MTGTGAMSRRRVLARVGLGVPLVGLAGCAGGGPISVLTAGSLHAAFTDGLQSLADPQLEVEAYGSAHAARLVADGQREPAIVALADPELFDTILATEWHALFASNAIVLAYNPATAGGRRVADAEPWFEPLLADGLTLGRTDPELDPLGYRTLFTLRLTADRAERPDLPDRILGPDQRYPETQVLARFETGSVDAAFVYRSMAEERGYPYRSLPAAVDLSDPGRAETYASVRYTFADGTTVAGAPIEYAAHLRTATDRTRGVFRTLVGSAAEYLVPHGFTVADRHPTYVGDVPPAIRG